MQPKISTFEDLKRRMAEQKKKQQSNSNSGEIPLWKRKYMFYANDIGTTSLVRFLPDLNPDSVNGFYQQVHYHEFKIAGTDGKTRKIRVGCNQHTHGKPCKFCALSKQFYDEGDRDNGFKFYRSVEYLTQAIIKSAPKPFEDETGISGLSSEEIFSKYKEVDGVQVRGNPIRLIAFSKGSKIISNIEQEIDDPDTNLTELPFGLDAGHDFAIKITAGDMNNKSYSASNFKAKVTSVTNDPELLDYIKNNLIDLSTIKDRYVDDDYADKLINQVLGIKTSNNIPANYSQNHQDSTPSLNKGEEVNSFLKQNEVMDDDVDVDYATPNNTGGNSLAVGVSPETLDVVRARIAAARVNAQTPKDED